MKGTHLSPDTNGTHITTNTLGTISQILDYYPYGDTRIDEGTTTETQQYTGYTKDTQTGLHYAGARYYANSMGRFISQDPVGLALGDEKTLTSKTNTTYRNYLSNPQTHNSYSYTANNPIKYVDKVGEFLWNILEGYFTPAIAYAPSNDVDIKSLPQSNPFAGKDAIKNIGLIALPGAIGSLKYADEAAVAVDRVSEIEKIGVSKNINIGGQEKHIIGSNNYNNLLKTAPNEIRSPLLHSNPQGLLDDFHAGSFDFKYLGQNTVLVDFKKIIGESVDNINKTSTITNFGKIHFGNKGSKIVPVTRQAKKMD